METHVACDGEVEPGRLGARVKEEGGDVGVVLEALDDALLLALAVGALEAHKLDPGAREGLHDQVERLLPAREDHCFGFGVTAAMQ